MAQFVEHNGNEQQQGRGQGHQPEAALGKGGGQNQAVVPLKGQGGRQQDQKPGWMDAQGDAADSEQLPALTHGSASDNG